MNKVRHTALALTSAALLGLAGTASAESQTPYTDLDRNGDGKISKTEAGADQQLSSQFQQIDTDGNGVLEWGEFARFESEGDMSEQPTTDMNRQPMGETTPR